MQARTPMLNQLLRKTAAGKDLSVDENVFVKKTYDDLRQRVENSLGKFRGDQLLEAAAASSEAEFRVYGLLWTLGQFEAGNMALEDAHRELLSIYRHPHDERMRVPALRADIAFYLSISSLLIKSQHVTRNRTMDLCVALELLANLSRLEQAQTEYERHHASKARVPAHSASHLAANPTAETAA